MINRKVSFYLASKFLADRDHIVYLNHSIMLYIEKTERPWGRFFVIHNETKYKLKKLKLIWWQIIISVPPEPFKGLDCHRAQG